MFSIKEIQFIVFGLLALMTGLTYPRKAITCNGKVFIFNENLETWTDADINCRKNGGLLAVVHSNEEHDLIVRNLQQMNGENYFVGGKKDAEDQWVWINGSPIDVRDKRWGTNEPNNFGNREDRLEYLFRDGTFAWNDIPHSKMGRYICQYCSPVDLLFAVDTSLSLDNKTYSTADNINKIVDRLLLDDESFNVAVMSYNLEQTEHVKLGQYRREDLKNAIKDISFNAAPGPTFTAKTLGKGIRILSRDDTHQIIVLMSDGLASDRKDAITRAELFTLSRYRIIVCIGVGSRIDHMELVQLASIEYHGEYGPLVFPPSTESAMNMIAKLTMRKRLLNVSKRSDVIIIQDNAVMEDVFSYSINIATEISRRYLLTKKDVRLGRLSYDPGEFAYYSQNLASFLSLSQMINYTREPSRGMEHLLSQADTILQSSSPQRNKVIVIISDGRWPNSSRIQEQMDELKRQNVMVMLVAISEKSDFTTIYNVIWDPFYVFYINDENRWPVIDVIVSQTFPIVCVKK